MVLCPKTVSALLLLLFCWFLIYIVGSLIVVGIGYGELPFDCEFDDFCGDSEYSDG